MDKLLKKIPDGHMLTMALKAKQAGTSTSAYIRTLIQKDAHIQDIVIRDVPVSTARALAINAAKSGLTIGDYLLNGRCGNE